MEKNIPGLVRLPGRVQVFNFLLLLSLGTIILVSSRSSLSQYYVPLNNGAGLYGRYILSPLPVNSVLTTGSLDPLTTILYLQRCEHFRTDVLVISRNRWTTKEYWPILQKNSPTAQKIAHLKKNSSLPNLIGSLLFTEHQIFWEGFEKVNYPHLQVEPEGIIFKVTALEKKSSPADFPDSPDHSLNIDEEMLDFLAQQADPLGKFTISNNWFNFSLYSLEKKDLKKTEFFLKKALALDPLNSKALNNFIAVLAMSGKNNQAEFWLQKALKHFPASSDFHYNYGFLLMHKSRYHLALEQFRNAANLKPRSAERWLVYADLLQQTGHIHQALAGYQKALQCQPELPEANLKLAALLIKTGAKKEAASILAPYLSSHPNDAQARQMWHSLKQDQ
ncbi:tetratricopeptide repeat protein [candidate division CSSED10-310 bacterium]|uniref:Tetratricopeptide repeat protein n=1 Tax=candidate division CSSED10-310 bacterium TaxID=2855610 RepID=A0ABV6YWC0_UNCC1